MNSIEIQNLTKKYGEHVAVDHISFQVKKGSLIGFLGGIYIPIGSLADSISGLMKCTPVIYGTSMFRKVMTQSVLENTFEGVPMDIVEEYREIMGIRLTIADYTLKLRDEWIILFACGMIFLGIGMCMLKYEKKTDR